MIKGSVRLAFVLASGLNTRLEIVLLNRIFLGYCKCNQPFEGFSDWMTKNLKGLTFWLSMCVVLKYLMQCSLMRESERNMKHWRKYSIKSLVKGKWSYIELSQELYKLKLKIQAWRQQKSFKSYQSLKFKIQAWRLCSFLFSPIEHRWLLYYQGGSKKVCFW